MNRFQTLISVKSIALFFRVRTIRVAYSIASAAWLIAFLVIIFRFSAKSGFIPLHYDIFFGIDRYGPWYMTGLPLVIGAMIIVINALWGNAIIARHRLESYLLAYGAALVNCIIVLYLVFLASFAF